MVVSCSLGLIFTFFSLSQRCFRGFCKDVTGERLSLGLGYSSLHILPSGSPAHSALGVLLSLCSFWCFLCRLPSLGPRTTFLCSLLCSHGTRHLPADPYQMSVTPPAHLCQDVRMMLPVSFILESAVIPRFHERAVELEKSGGIGESRANKRTWT